MRFRPDLPMLIPVGVSRRLVFILVAGALAASIFVAGTQAAPKAPSTSLRSLESSVLVDINAFRSAHGLARLRLNVGLNGAAQQHTLQMAADGYFAHDSADGSAFWKRIRRYYPSSGSRLWSVGENLVWSSPSLDAKGALQMWLASPEHRANLMNPRWREIGVSAVHTVAAPGVYNGLDVTIVTTDFGVRR
jgi:uncharacterized protein YkwD